MDLFGRFCTSLTRSIQAMCSFFSSPFAPSVNAPKTQTRFENDLSKKLFFLSCSVKKKSLLAYFFNLFLQFFRVDFICLLIYTHETCRFSKSIRLNYTCKVEAVFSTCANSCIFNWIKKRPLPNLGHLQFFRGKKSNTELDSLHLMRSWSAYVFGLAGSR